MAAVSNDRLCGCAAVGLDDDRPARQRSRAVYLLPPGGFVGALPLPWLAKGEVGAASFGFSFFGFLASRFPFGMAAAPSSGLSVAPVEEITSLRPKFPQQRIVGISP